MNEQDSATKTHARTCTPPWPAWAVLVVIVACGNHTPVADSPFDAASGDVAEFSDVFEVVDTVVLEENDSVLNALPVVNSDGQRFVVTDPYAYQVRIYTTRGELLWARGKQGQGPGEFMSPHAAQVIEDGRIAVIDLTTARITYFDPNASVDPVVETVPFFVQDMISISDERRLFVAAGPPVMDGEMPALHLWNEATAAVESSFFSPPVPSHLANANRRTSVRPTTVLGDTIWVAHPLLDTLYAFGMDGSPIRSIPLPPLNRQVQPDEMPWAIGSFHFLSNGDIAVRLWKAEPETRTFTRTLAIVDDEGDPRALLSSAPELYAVVDDLFYFQNPDRMEPSHWIVARRRSPS